MRASYVFEKFEEKSDPIADLNIGGVNFQEDYIKLYNKWINNIKSVLEGKTINAYMEKYYIKDGYKPMSNEGNMTVTIESIDSPTINYMTGNNLIYWKLYFYDENHERYSLSLDQKIRIVK
jgi:hypothetical protein